MNNMTDDTLPALVGGPSIYKTDELIETGRRAHVSLCRDLGDGQTFNRTLVGDLADELARSMAQIADMEAEMDRDHQLEAKAEMPRAWLDVMGERVRQIAEEGWTPEHDDRYVNGEMAIAGAWYALNAPYSGDENCCGIGNGSSADSLFAGYSAHRWPWSMDWWKPTNHRRDLVKTGALILAEIERLDRAAQALSDRQP